MSALPLIIDCDPGQDDAVALLLALAAPAELDILGITTVAGNVPLDLTHENARRICELARRTEIPVHAGCPRPLLRPLDTAEAVHGTTGMAGADLPTPRMALAARHAVDFIVDSLMMADQPITLVALGPLTNLAVALVKQPRIADAVRRVVLMGGAMGHGNTTPVAEFNIHVDPHAARILFEAGLPITMLGLDVTHQALATPARIAAIRALGTEVGETVARMLTLYTRFDRDRYAWPGGPLHDPCVIAYLLQPDLFSGHFLRVDVETEGRLSLGQTVVDRWGMSGLPPNVLVIDRMDIDGFFALLTGRLGRL